MLIVNLWNQQQELDMQAVSQMSAVEFARLWTVGTCPYLAAVCQPHILDSTVEQCNIAMSLKVVVTVHTESTCCQSVHLQSSSGHLCCIDSGACYQTHAPLP